MCNNAYKMHHIYANKKKVFTGSMTSKLVLYKNEMPMSIHEWVFLCLVRGENPIVLKSCNDKFSQS